MLWVVVFGAIALIGLAVLVSYAVWLAHRAGDVMSEVRVLADRGGQLVELLGQVEVPAFGSVAEPVDGAVLAPTGDPVRAT